MDDETGDSRTRRREVVRAVSRLVRTSVALCTEWVERRSRLTQLIVGAVIALLAEQTIPVLRRAAALWVSGVASASTLDGVLALICVQLGQAAVLVHKLEMLSHVLERMEETTRADGGRQERSWRSGGGILGGALAGATLGTAYGSRGVVVGAVVGAILGDTFEEWIARP